MPVLTPDKQEAFGGQPAGTSTIYRFSGSTNTNQLDEPTV